MNDREREAYLNRIGYEGELRTEKMSGKDNGPSSLQYSL